MANAMRPLISYDDITLPYEANPLQNQPARPPPNKKRKWNKSNYNKGRNEADATGWASHNHGNSAGQPSTFSSVKVNANGDESMDAEEDEGRDLTHDEIWDDSALIDAWNAATEEYEAYNGPDKGWKNKPVHNSPLWYNVPKPSQKDGPSTSNGHVSVPKSTTAQEEENENSNPLDFDTFMPTHDPSLQMPVPAIGPETAPQFLSDASGFIVSQDEAFTRALGAMYWSGYWTAMYHARRPLAQGQGKGDKESKGEEDSYDYENEHGEEGEEEEEDEEEELDAEGDEDMAFVSTQR